MASSNKTLWIVLGTVGGFLLLGCCGIAGLIGLVVNAARESADQVTKANYLNELGIAIHNYHDQHQRMPANVDDILPFVDPGFTERLRSGEIEVIWNALSFNDEKRSPSNVIMAWFTTPTADGLRPVLFMDGSVGAITEIDFQKRPKAQVVQKK